MKRAYLFKTKRRPHYVSTNGRAHCGLNRPSNCVDHLFGALQAAEWPAHINLQICKRCEPRNPERLMLN